MRVLGPQSGPKYIVALSLNWELFETSCCAITQIVSSDQYSPSLSHIKILTSKHLKVLNFNEPHIWPLIAFCCWNFIFTNCITQGNDKFPPPPKFHEMWPTLNEIHETRSWDEPFERSERRVNYVFRVKITTSLSKWWIVMWQMHVTKHREYVSWVMVLLSHGKKPIIFSIANLVYKR